MKTKNSQSELVAFIGVFVSALQKEGYQPSEIKHLVTSELVSEAVNLCKDTDGNIDDFGIKPVLTMANNYLKMQMNQETKDAYIPQIAEDIAKLKKITNYLDARLDKITNPRSTTL